MHALYKLNKVSIVKQIAFKLKVSSIVTKAFNQSNNYKISPSGVWIEYNGRVGHIRCHLPFKRSRTTKVIIHFRNSLIYPVSTTILFLITWLPDPMRSHDLPLPPYARFIPVWSGFFWPRDITRDITSGSHEVPWPTINVICTVWSGLVRFVFRIPWGPMTYH